MRLSIFKHISAYSRVYYHRIHIRSTHGAVQFHKEAQAYRWTESDFVDSSKLHDESVQADDLLVMQNVITEHEQQQLADECNSLFQRRRYESDHWDSVIVKFREVERSRWSPGVNILSSYHHYNNSDKYILLYLTKEVTMNRELENSSTNS